MKNTKRILSGLLVLVMVLALLPVSVFAAEAEDVTINIAQLTNGTVTADKDSYKIGDTVTLTVAPNSGYAQQLYIDGEPMLLNWGANTYSFVAEKESYNITGSFVSALSFVAGDISRWNTNNMAHGLMTTYYPKDNDSWWAKINGEYTSFAITAKNYRSAEYSYEGGPDGGWREVIYMQLDNGKYYAFSMWIDANKAYAYNHFGGNISGVASTTGWSGNWRNVSVDHPEAAIAINGEGAEFRITRTDGNHFQITLNGAILETYTIADVTAANKVISVGTMHYGNKGTYVDIPFQLSKAFVEVNLPTGLEHGSITASKDSYAIGETVTLNIEREVDYYQQLYINGKPMILDWPGGNTYSFVATEPVYDITGSFVPGINITASDWARWDEHNQGHGILTTYYPNDNDSWWMTFNGEYQSVTVGAKNYMPLAETKDNFMVALKVTLESGRNYSFRIWTNTDGVTAYCRLGIQNAGDAGADWGGYKNLSYLDGLITTEGVSFKVERTAGNVLTLSVNGEVLDNYTMPNVTAADKIASVGVKHQGNKGYKVEVPFYLQAVDTPDAEVIIPELANGTVTADKESYKVGDTVNLTIAPNAGYAQQLYVNGEPVILGWQNFTYSFVATEPVMEITGAFVPAISFTAGSPERWNTSNLAQGLLTTYYTTSNDSWWAKFNGEFQSFSIIAKNYRPIANSYEGGPDGGWREIIYMQLDNGNYYAFSMWIDTNKAYAYNHYGGNICSVPSTTGWGGNWRDISGNYKDAAAAINGEGAEFKITRIDGNHFQITLNGAVLETYEIPGATAANKVISAGVQHHGNKGAYVDIPFVLEAVPAHTHKYEAVVTEPTCSAAGYTTYTCDCGDSYVADEVPAKEHEYFAPCDAHCMICGELTNPDAAHSLTHVEAKSATCTENGNIEYWMCEYCNAAWNNAECTGVQLSRFDVIVVAQGHDYLYPCDAHCMICGELTNENATHNISHVDAVAGDCQTMGNLEYWFCNDCGACWLDEALTLVTNSKAVITGYGDHVKVSYVNNGDGTHTGTCECGEIVADHAAHNFGTISTITGAASCADCGAKAAGFAAMNMNLGNSLTVNFLFDAGSLGTGNYVVIEKEYANETPTAVITYQQSNPEEWKMLNARVAQISFSGVAAKEMTDDFKVTIYNAAGNPVSATFVGSIESFLVGSLNKSSDAITNAVYVDLLNYGAAAQDALSYNLEKMANANLTEEQQEQFASEKQTPVDNRVKGTGYVQSNVELGNSIKMNVLYQVSKLPNVSYAKISFTNHQGDEVEDTIEELTYLNNNKVIQVTVQNMKIADCEEAITIELYDTNDNLISTSVDSIGAFVASKGDSATEIFSAIMKLSYSAGVYFDNK